MRALTVDPVFVWGIASSWVSIDTLRSALALPRFYLQVWRNVLRHAEVRKLPMLRDSAACLTLAILQDISLRRSFADLLDADKATRDEYVAFTDKLQAGQGHELNEEPAMTDDSNEQGPSCAPNGVYTSVHRHLAGASCLGRALPCRVWVCCPRL